MPLVRHRLPWVVCVWLTCQIAGVVAAPVAFCCSHVQTADDDKCCPGLLPGQICPMHHTREGERTCKMRNACARADAALIALGTVTGLVSQSTSVVNVFEPGTFVADEASSALRRAHIPESPPPRA